METNNTDLKYLKAKNRVEKLKRFYNHLTVYIIINSIITGFKVYNNLDSWESFKNELLSFDVLSSWTVWGLVLVIHFISVVFFQDWEERKIEAYMRKENETKRWD
ncbi:2TM domain-containing protein [Winogradskyella sp. Asnod2-B02-A]|uniref:2TM domain-containing protein n=1 Tax=Winogradskyella sp. Asnod2-B02-A TaxID=3160583 RepID=UPI0038654B86